jgi:hypothetical protein
MYYIHSLLLFIAFRMNEVDNLDVWIADQVNMVLFN